MPPTATTPGRWHAGLALLLVFAVYAPSLGNGYAVDADYLANPVLRSGAPHPVMGELHGPAFYFRRNYWAGTSSYDGLYRPVTIYSFALTNHLIGAGGTPHHVVDLALHLLAVVLVWLLLAELAVPATARLVTGLLFGVHAIHHEVVASIVGRSELLAFVCGVGAVLLFGRGTARARTLSGVLLFLAFCAKESALAWIAFIPCFEFARGRLREPRPWLAGLPLVVLPPLLAWFALRHAALADFAHIPREIDNLKNPLAHVDTTTRLLTAVKVWGYGLYKCLVPYPLSYIYGLGTFSLVTSPADTGFLLAAAALLTLLGSGLWFGRSRPLLFLAAALVIGFGITASNLPFVAGTIFAERLYYTPSLGLALLVTLACVRFARPRNARCRGALWIGITIYALGNIAVIVHRNPLWHDEETLVRHDVHSQPDSANILNDLSGYLWHADPPDKAGAIACIDRALEIYREFPQALYKQGANFLSGNDPTGALGRYAAASHSPYIQITLRLALQPQLERMLFPQGIQAADPAALVAAVRAHGDYAAAWVAGIRQALRDPAFPYEVLRALAAEGGRRFPGDELIAIQRGVVLALPGLRDAAHARRILAAFPPGLWWIQPGDMADPHFVRAHLIAASCHAVLGGRRAALAILDRLLDNPALPPAVQRELQAQRNGIAERHR